MRQRTIAGVSDWLGATWISKSFHESPNRDDQPTSDNHLCNRVAAACRAILNQSRSVDLAERRRDYEAGGWTGFDAEAEDYTPDEIERDRARDLNRL
ncbi:MAG: hypothetical protein E5Y88_14860 [Mesorhizobium sp.]|nr:hypothetical protein EJ075_28620 [Mesorhizobium sp. M6A.T.Cr.TU.016.01.1.1]RUU25721.1 hypothetical protein EOC94_30180 [Mesorhizobium sp. M6A.T.Ce.TU.016.01.1.1]RUU44582.1 hypothetical protein EOC93_10530 [Mesorhizobium sp. M6A.T.Ce.TU.002.03.1.1]RUV01955.1 hypothetical protein EOB36_11370 [Mesorhizobium sp. M6A.T.Cr.TU.017.01.1.1]RVB79989.1 hypothetical protein EN885_03685 [Mesorhizobium sp. M6A.T.Cr.TU.014.01.1.1]RWN24325.1 MAG: hypothetical protein EOR95_33325 [Mesorhizobium sp.]